MGKVQRLVHRHVHSSEWKRGTSFNIDLIYYMVYCENFTCNSCQEEFSAPLDQSFTRFNKGATQFCAKCSSIIKINQIHKKKLEDIV